MLNWLWLWRESLFESLQNLLAAENTRELDEIYVNFQSCWNDEIKMVYGDPSDYTGLEKGNDAIIDTHYELETFLSSKNYSNLVNFGFTALWVTECITKQKNE